MTSKMTPHLSRQSLEEELSNTTLPIIKGKIPEWLSGTLIRNGPAKFEAGTKRIYHWFDGLAMLHGFSFHQGTVVYSNRFLRTHAYQQVLKGSISFSGFACDPCRSLFRRLTTILFPSQEHEIPNANVNVSQFADAYVALTETPLPVEFNLKTLQTAGVFLYRDQLPKANCWESAHPHVDSERGETINYLLKFGLKGTYVIHRMRHSSRTREVIAEIPVVEPAYMHSFSITENHVVLTEYPLVIDPLAPLLKNKGFIQNFVWKPDRGTRFTIIRRDSGQLIKQVTTDPFFAFHHVNAFEKGHDLLIDIVRYPDASIIYALADYGDGIKNPAFPHSRVVRYQLDLNTWAINQTLLTDLPLELPRIHSPKYEGKHYRYVYGPDLREAFDISESRSLYKVDLDTQKVWEWSEAGCYPGEAVFVPSPKSQAEDDGIILALVLDEKVQRSFLLVLNAQTFQEMGRAEVPHHIPAGLHGLYYT